uniref:LigA n=1 Tax=Parastrongyloides trichosuri TaxID=131310 RepID=A0A0N4ZGP7_PARTI
MSMRTQPPHPPRCASHLLPRGEKGFISGSAGSGPARSRSRWRCHNRHRHDASRRWPGRSTARAPDAWRPPACHARRQALEGDALARHVQPAVQAGVVREELLHRLIRFADVLGIARQGGPAERADTTAEQRTDIGRHEAGEVERVLHAFFQRHLSQVVAVVHGRHAQRVEAEHGADVVGHGFPCGGLDGGGVADALFLPLGDGPARGQVAVDRVVRAGLIGHQIGANAALDHFRQKISCIAQQADRQGFLVLERLLQQGQGLVQRFGHDVDVAGAQAELDAAALALDGDAGGAGHGRGQRLGAAHAAQARRQNPLAGPVAVIVLATRLHEGLIGALNDALGADVDPRSGGHLAVHGQALLIEFVEVVPVGPVRHQVGVGDQHARRVDMGAEHADRLARLDHQRLVGFQFLELVDDGVERLPVAGRLADAAIDHQLMRALGDIRVQIVHQHAHRRFGAVSHDGSGAASSSHRGRHRAPHRLGRMAARFPHSDRGRADGRIRLRADDGVAGHVRSGGERTGGAPPPRRDRSGPSAGAFLGSGRHPRHPVRGRGQGAGLCPPPAGPHRPPGARRRGSGRAGDRAGDPAPGRRPALRLRAPPDLSDRRARRRGRRLRRPAARRLAAGPHALDRGRASHLRRRRRPRDGDPSGSGRRRGLPAAGAPYLAGRSGRNLGGPRRGRCGAESRLAFRRLRAGARRGGGAGPSRPHDSGRRQQRHHPAGRSRAGARQGAFERRRPDAGRPLRPTRHGSGPDQRQSDPGAAG